MPCASAEFASGPASEPRIEIAMSACPACSAALASPRLLPAACTGPVAAVKHSAIAAKIAGPIRLTSLA